MMPGTTITDLRLDIFTYKVSFLTSNDLISYGQTNKYFGMLCQTDSIWEKILAVELGIFPGTGTTRTLRNSRSVYVNWRMRFSGFTLDEIRYAKNWWDRIEFWLTKSAPDILTTLNAPATDEDFTLFTSVTGHSVPRILQLLYKFHNGQNLVFDKTRFDGWRPEPGTTGITHDDLHRSIFSGLFGGYQFYDTFINMRFLPLRHCAKITKDVCRRAIKVVKRPKENGSVESKFHHSTTTADCDDGESEDCRVDDVDGYDDEDADYQPSDHAERKVADDENFKSYRNLCVFSCNAILGSGLEKVYCISEDDPSSVVTVNDILTNFG